MGTVVSTGVVALTGAAPAGAGVPPATTPNDCINNLGGFVSQEITTNSFGLSATGQPTGIEGVPVALSQARLNVNIPGSELVKLYQGRSSGNYSLLNRGANTLPVEYWVSIKASNTVEGTQTVYVKTTYTTTVTDPTPNSDPTITDVTDYAGRTSGDESATDFTATVTLPATTWTPTGDGPVSFSQGDPGTISQPVDALPVPAPALPDPFDPDAQYISQPDGTIRIDGTSTHNMSINPYWVKPFGSVFVRVGMTSNLERPQTGSNTNGYGLSLDCVAGDIAVNADPDGAGPLTVPGRNAHGAFDPDVDDLYGWVTKSTAGVPSTGWDLMVNGGAAGRYAITADPAVNIPFAEALLTPQGNYDCINSLGAYAGQELSPFTFDLTASGNPSAPAGAAFDLDTAELEVNIPAEWALQLYRGRAQGNYSLLNRGENSVSTTFWVAIEGTNTVEGTQTVKVPVTYTPTITDPTPNSDPTITDVTNFAGRNSLDEAATDFTATVSLPATTWTPNGNGPVTFNGGAPGSISYVDDVLPTPTPALPDPFDPDAQYISQPEGTVRVDGTSTHNMSINPYWVKPFGSVFVRVDTKSNPERAETGVNVNGYGVNLDCVLGDLEVKADPDGAGPLTVPGRNAHGAFAPDVADLYGWVTKSTAGVPSTGWDLMVNGGADGRYDITPATAPTFAELQVPVTFSDVPSGHTFATQIDALAADGIVSGYEDGTFRPAGIVSRQAYASFLYKAAGSPAVTLPSTPSFSDVPAGHTFAKAIEWAKAEGIVGGYGDGTFQPSATVSRQAAAAFLYRFAGEPTFADPAAASFADVPTGHTFFTEVEWARANDVVRGYEDGTFGPSRTVTRQAAAAFIYAYLQLP